MVKDQKKTGAVNSEQIMLHHDNAKLYAAFMTRQKIAELGNSVASIILPSLVPSDYHLFPSSQNFLKGTSPRRSRCQPSTARLLYHLKNYPFH